MGLICCVCAEDMAHAERMKGQANELFKRGKLKAAIDGYTEAIAFAPDMHVLFVNRALCHRKLEDWASCERDARTALCLQSGLMKVRAVSVCSISERCECTRPALR